MRLSTRDGINCDHCGTLHKSDFTYYSLDFHSAAAHNNMRPTIDTILRSSIVFSLDFCQACFDSLSKTVINNFKASKSKFFCEVTGKAFSGTYSYYYVNVTKANVRINGQPYICIKCREKAFDNKPCKKCGGTQLMRPAAVTTMPRFLEIVMCEDAYITLRKQAELILKTASQWSTSGE